MKIALVADIHGNIVALDAVLHALETERPDRVICLGDVAAKGPAPSQVVDRLMLHRDWTFIMGNTDEWLLDRIRDVATNERERKQIEAALWGHDQLNAEQRAFIGAFRPNAALDLGVGQLLAYHGSPDSNVTEIRPETPLRDLGLLLEPWPARIYAGAHTHIRMLRPFRSSLVINPGSVGMASALRTDGSDHLAAHAEFALVEFGEGGIAVDFRELPLDRAALISSTTESSNPDAAWWAEGWSA